MIIYGYVVLVKMQKIPDFFEKPRTHTTVLYSVRQLHYYITGELTPEKRNIFYNNHDEGYLRANGSTLSATPTRQKRKDWTKEIIIQKQS